MKNIFRIYLPSVSIAFTFVVLANIIIFSPASSSGYVIPASYLLAILATIVCVDIFDFLVSMAPFKTRFSYLAVTSLGEYGIVLISTVLFRWDIFDPSIFIFTTLIFFGCLILIHTYFRVLRRHEADEINRLLQTRSSSRTNDSAGMGRPK